jgi:hypothetical protein
MRHNLLQHGGTHIRCILRVIKVHEPKPSRPASQVIIDNVDMLEFSVSTEYLLQIFLRRVETETKHPQDITGTRVESVSLVSLSVGEGRSGARVGP